MTTGTTEMADLYDACLAEVDSLAAGLTPEQLATRSPATPGWTVHQVLAHLAGSASDAVSGRMDGAPGEESTARHVAERDVAAPSRAGRRAAFHPSTRSPPPPRTTQQLAIMSVTSAWA